MHSVWPTNRSLCRTVQQFNKPVQSKLKKVQFSGQNHFLGQMDLEGGAGESSIVFCYKVLYPLIWKGSQISHRRNHEQPRSCHYGLSLIRRFPPPGHIGDELRQKGNGTHWVGHSCENPHHPDHMPYPTLSYRLRSAGYDARCDIRGVGRLAGWLEAHTASPESYIGT